MKRLLKVTSFTALLTLLRMGCGFVIAKVVAIYTGPSGLAMLGQLQSIVSSLNGISSAPAGNAVIRYTAENYSQGFESCSPWWRAAVHWILIILAIMVPLGCILAYPLSILVFSNTSYAWLIVVTTLCLPLSVAGTLINSVINGQQKYRRFVGLGMVSVLLSTVVMLFFIISKNLSGALFAVAIQSGLIGCVMLVATLREPWFKLQFWWGTSTTTERKSVRNYILMAITSALTTPLSLVLVRLILVNNVGWNQAGYWQAVWKISEVYLGVITMALGTYYLPRLSLIKNDVVAMRQEINKTAKVVLPLVTVMALAVYFFRDLTIKILFTPEFKLARELFLIQLFGDVAKIASWLYAYPMLSRGATKWYIASEITFSISLVVLTWIFVNIFGVQGANSAYLVNYILYFCFSFLTMEKFSR